MKKLRPNIIRIGASLHRLDLRSKTFDAVRGIAANGRKSLEFSVLAEAERKADEIQDLLESYGKKRMETFKTALQVDIGQLQDRLTPFGKTIADAVDFYANHLTAQSAAFKSQTIKNLMADWLADKKQKMDTMTLSKDMYETLYYKANGQNGYVAQWGERPVATLTSQEIETWINGLQIRVGKGSTMAASQRSKKHQLSYLSQFFHWCIRKQYVANNPCQSISIETPDVEPVCFTAEEAQKIMAHCRQKRFMSLIPFHAICLFAGVRPDECSRLTWDAIDWDDRSIVVKYSQSKTTGRRIPLQPNLYSWLHWFRSNYSTYSLIPPVGFGDKKRQFRKTLGYWKENGMRHSFASYILGGKLGDYADLEQWMGNSRTMLQKHYLTYPPKAEAEKFWSIVPL